MKNIFVNKSSNKGSIIAWIWVFIALIFVTNSSVIAWIMWYWSDSDYTNPVTSLSWVTQVLSGQTLTWATQVTLTQAVQFSSGSVSVIIPNTTIITNATGSLFDATSIGASLLSTLPISLATTEQDVGKINFWITWVKLNFNKPVKISIPVSTTNSTVKILVKHAWIDWYQTFALTDSVWSSCSNWIATPSSNVAPVVSWIATIYTCSASQFIAVTDKVVSSSSSSSSSSGGSSRSSGSRLHKDVCPAWDFSPSYYDRTCGTKPLVLTNTWSSILTSTWSSTKPSNWSSVLLSNNTDSSNLSLQTVTYKWINVVVYNGYNLTKKSNEISVNVIESVRLTEEQKKSYINRQNEFMVAKYNLDIAQDDEKIKKNKYNKQFVLLIWATEKLKKDFNL